jgi:probable O-glycosylation ligase (exosortase A-associated)
MRTLTGTAPEMTTPAAPPGTGVARGAPSRALERFRLTLPFAGLAVYLWVIHSARLPIASHAIALGLFGLVLQAQPLRLPAPLAWFGGFFLWALATTPSAQFPDVTWDKLVDFGKLWLVFLLASNVARTKRQLQVLMITWLGIFAFYPVRGTMFNFVFRIGEFGRYAWNFIFSNPNDLAALTLPILAMSIAVLQGEKEKKKFKEGGWIRLSALAGVIVLPAMIFVTQSRGGILALFTMGLLVLVQYRRQARTFAVLVLVAGVIGLAAPPDVWTRLGGLSKAGDSETLGQVDVEGSADQRFEIWRVAGAIIADHPVTGVGLGGYPKTHQEYALSSRFKPIARGSRDTHSIYLNVMAETGVVGFILLMGMMLTALWQGWRAAKDLETRDPSAAKQMWTLNIGLIAFMQAGIFASLHRVAFVYVYLAVLTTAIFALGSQTALPLRRQSPSPVELPPSDSRRPAPSTPRRAAAAGPLRPGVRRRPG